MRSPIRMLVLGLVLATGSGCATGPVITADYDRSANVTAYRTFAFAEPLGTDTAGYESLVTQTVKAASRHEMEARGYTYTESDPDLLVNFNGRLERRTAVSQTPAAPMYYGYRRGFYGGWGGYAFVVDAQRKQLVWEGVAVGRVGRKAEDGRHAALRAAVAEIFEKYPFRAGG